MAETRCHKGSKEGQAGRGREEAPEPVASGLGLREWRESGLEGQLGAAGSVFPCWRPSVWPQGTAGPSVLLEAHLGSPRGLGSDGGSAPGCTGCPGPDSKALSPLKPSTPSKAFGSV